MQAVVWLIGHLTRTMIAQKELHELLPMKQ